MGSFSLLQGIFPTQGSNPGLPHCRRILYQLSHQGSPSLKQGLISSLGHCYADKVNNGRNMPGSGPGTWKLLERNAVSASPTPHCPPPHITLPYGSIPSRLLHGHPLLESNIERKASRLCSPASLELLLSQTCRNMRMLSSK